MAKKLRINMQTAMTFEEGIEEFLLNCEARNLRQGTMKHYRKQQRFSDDFGGKKLKIYR